MSEEQLLARARRGDNTAREELVMRHAPRLLSLARGLMGGSDADVGDVVQETFLTAFDGGLWAFRRKAQLSTWFNGILVNRVRKLRRYRWVRRAKPLDDVEGSSALSPTTSPATQVEQRMDVASMLDTLSPEYREAIVLRELQGMTYAEMGQILGIPERTAETRLTRARRALRERFADYFDGTRKD